MSEKQELEKLIGSTLYEGLCQEYPGNMITVLCALALRNKELDDEVWTLVERITELEGKIRQWS